MDSAFNSGVKPGPAAHFGNEGVNLRRTKKEIEELVLLFRGHIDDNNRSAWRIGKLFDTEGATNEFLAGIARDVPSNDSPIDDRRRCCHWEGLLTTKGKYAVAQVPLPETMDPWITFTNRLIVFCFGRFKRWGDLALVKNGPFYMKCSNPRCIRLSHILYKKEDVQEFKDQLKQKEQEEEDLNMQFGQDNDDNDNDGMIDDFSDVELEE